MKRKIYLPVLAMFSLVLFSFTTNRAAEGTVIPTGDGNFLLENVQLDEADLFRIDQLTERISISGEITEESAARGIWLYRNKKWDENKFTQKTLIGTSAIPLLTDEDQVSFRQAEVEINEMMQRYMH
jgi:hypothetical protein